MPSTPNFANEVGRLQRRWDTSTTARQSQSIRDTALEAEAIEGLQRDLEAAPASDRRLVYRAAQALETAQRRSRERRARDHATVGRVADAAIRHRESVLRLERHRRQEAASRARANDAFNIIRNPIVSIPNAATEAVIVGWPGPDTREATSTTLAQGNGSGSNVSTSYPVDYAINNRGRRIPLVTGVIARAPLPVDADMMEEVDGDWVTLGAPLLESVVGRPISGLAHRVTDSTQLNDGARHLARRVIIPSVSATAAVSAH